MNYSKQLFSSFCLLLSFSALYAQPILPGSEVDVVRSFEARLAEAERVGVSPVLPPPDTSIRRQNYSVLPRPLNVDYPAPIIRPRGLSREKPESTQNGLIKAGLGFPNAFYGDLSYNIVGLENFDLGFYAHRHSFDNSKNVENQKMGDTQFGAQGTYYNEKGFAIQLGATYTGMNRYFYGYNFPEVAPDTLPSFTETEVSQRFNIFDFNGSLFNGVRTEADFNYSADVDFYLMDGEAATRENGFALTLKATKWLADRDPLDFRLRTDFTGYRDTSSQSLNNFYFNTAYTAHLTEQLKVKFGAMLTSNDDNFNIFPDIEASAIVVPGVATVFLGADGDLQKNTLRSLADYNPWIRTRIRVRNSEYNRLYAGVSGAAFGLNYRLEAAWKNVKNLALFQLDYNREIPQFDVLYDTARIFSLQASASLPLVKNLDVTGTLTQNIYSLDREEKPWHLPSLSLNTAAIYTMPEQGVQIRADLFMQNGVPYLTAAGEAKNLNALFDLSLSGEYQVTDNIGLWLQLNNLANNKRQRFAQYPTIGFNVMAGASVRF